MAAAKEKAEAAPASAAPASGGTNKLVVILTAVSVVASLATVAISLIAFQKDKGQARVEDIAVSDAHGGGAAEGGGGGHGEAKPDAHGGGGGGAHGKSDSKKGGDFGKMVTLEQFTVNLATAGSVNPKFVRVNISLEVPNGETEGEVVQKMPQVRNAIIDLFNSKRPSDLVNAEGRDYLKEEIRNALNGFMVTGKVKGVFFTNFALSS